MGLIKLREILNSNGFFRFISSATLAYVLILLLTLYLGYYILIPQQQQEFTAHHSIFFRVLLFAIGVNIIFGTVKRFVFKISQCGFLLTHLGLIVIIVGASVSSFVGNRGLLMIEEGNNKNYYVVFKESPRISKEAKMPKFDRFPLPFTVKLLKFSIDYYYNSFIPKDYKSLLEISNEKETFLYEVKMNVPFKYKGYEIFQSDFALGQGKDGANVSVLSVNYDPGKNISFIGFLILSVGIVNLFLLKNFWKYIERRFQHSEFQPATLNF